MASCANQRRAKPGGLSCIGPASGVVGPQSVRALKPKHCALDVPAPISGLWNTHQTMHLVVTVVPNPWGDVAITDEGLRDLPVPNRQSCAPVTERRSPPSA